MSRGGVRGGRVACRYGTRSRLVRDFANVAHPLALHDALVNADDHYGRRAIGSRRGACAAYAPVLHYAASSHNDPVVASSERSRIRKVEDMTLRMTLGMTLSMRQQAYAVGYVLENSMCVLDNFEFLFDNLVCFSEGG